MKLNFNQLLTVAAFFGTVNCDGKDKLKTKLEHGLNHFAKPYDSKDPSVKSPLRQKMIIALQYPKCFIDKKFVLDDVDLKCKDDNAHEFYNLSFKDGKNIAAFSSYCKTNKDLTKLTDEDLKKEIQDQYNSKKAYLEAIIENIPIVNDYIKRLDDEFDLIIQSHIRQFVADSLVYDGKILTFSALLKAVKSILAAHEVDRKANDAISAAIDMIGSEKTKWIKIENIIETGMVIKESEPVKVVKKADEVVVEKPKNIISVALKASDKSTSSPSNLLYFLVASLLLATLLLGFKAYTTKPAKEEEENGEE